MIKIAALQHMCERNRDFDCGVVISDIYTRISFCKLHIGRKRHALFVGAYSICFARFALVGAVDGEELRVAAESIYELFAAHDGFSCIKKKESLACAIYLTVRTADGRKLRKLVQGMGGDEAEVARILAAVRAYALEETEAAAADASETADAEDAAPAKGEGPSDPDEGSER